ncbi:MAG: hypothetical protein HRU16_01250 [Planctomycetes bacterium]|nr:hypothetical protein [Planctomycetota bacterium]
MSEQDSSKSTGGSSIDPSFLALLCCPCPDRRPLEQGDHGLCCSGCERVFPVVDGIPRILLDQDEEARD